MLKSSEKFRKFSKLQQYTPCTPENQCHVWGRFEHKKYWNKLRKSAPEDQINPLLLPPLHISLLLHNKPATAFIQNTINMGQKHIA